MEAYLVTTPIGVIAVSEGKAIKFKPFLDEKEAARKFLESREKLIEEEKELKEELERMGYEVLKGKEEFVMENLPNIAIEFKLVKNENEFNKLYARACIEIAKLEIRNAIKREDIILHANNALDELNRTINLFVERLRDWYSLHFPELERSIKDHEKFVKLVAEFCERGKFEGSEFEELAKESVGADFSADDIEMVKSYAQLIISFFKLRKQLEKYLEKNLRKIAPNLTEIAGPTLAAKLIAKAGSLEKLAKMPSSTIQLIGSEKALFRFLRGKGKSPKHGLIFIHPLIQNAPKKLRGKVARALASKLSMAVKLDYFSKEYKADELKKELNERVREILSKK